MSEPLTAEKEFFARVLYKMIDARPAPKAEPPKSKKRLTRIIKQVTPTSNPIWPA
jgi:hypothetical protein